MFKPNVEKLKDKKNVKGLIKALRYRYKDPEQYSREELIRKGMNAFKEGSYVRAEATRALAEIGEPAVEPLIQALKNEYRSVRNGAATALGEMGDARAVEPLIQALKDEDRGIREEAATALGKMGDARAVEPLIQALKDEDRYVREGAAEALEELGWQVKHGINKVYYLIAKEQWDKIVGMREPAVEILIHALKDKEGDVRSGAAWALGEIGDARAVEQLIQAQQDENWDVRWRAAEALEKIGESAIEPPTKALKDEDKYVQEAAKEVLEKIKEK